MTALEKKPTVRRDAFVKALQLSREKLAQSDFPAQCEKAGAEIIESDASGRKTARIKFLYRDYRVAYPSGAINYSDSDDEVLPYDQILILHYLAHASGAPLAGEIISYQQIPDGWLYYPSFLERTTYILARTFAKDPEGFRQAGLAIGGNKSALGELAIEIIAFPKVSYHLIMWPGDDELDTEFSCVFDRSLTEYLPAEDITVLANVISSRLAQKSGKGNRK